MKLKSLPFACLIALSMFTGAQTTISIAPDAVSKEEVRADTGGG
jgi:hypothetical protein